MFVYVLIVNLFMIYIIWLTVFQRLRARQLQDMLERSVYLLSERGRPANREKNIEFDQRSIQFIRQFKSADTVFDSLRAEIAYIAENAQLVGLLFTVIALVITCVLYGLSADRSVLVSNAGTAFTTTGLACIASLNARFTYDRILLPDLAKKTHAYNLFRKHLDTPDSLLLAGGKA